MDFVAEFDEIIRGVSSLLGKPLAKGSYEIIDRGIPHQPRTKPNGKMGVYTFWYDGRFLKIGKAGPNSNSRFFDQNYKPKSANSTLAAYILADEHMHGMGISEDNVDAWIKNNCRRVDILLDASLSIFSLELIEAALHYKYEPVYEGYEAQR